MRIKISAMLICASLAYAHYTWIAPGTAKLEAGKTVKVMIAHGHKFPQSEEAINATQVKAWVVSPSGTRTDLKPAVNPGVIVADFLPKEGGSHRLVFTQDRGMLSRTPRGVKPGGKDKNPDATESFRILRTGVSYTGAMKAPKPLGLETELTAELVNGQWIVTLFKEGKPLSGHAVQVLRNGQKDAADIGRTGADGRVMLKNAADITTPVLFQAEFAQAENRYTTSLYVSW